jgi:hypothetical protein
MVKSLCRLITGVIERRLLERKCAKQPIEQEKANPKILIHFSRVTERSMMHVV